MSNSNWTLEDLQNHLAMAIDLEFWTIPFYRVAYHAISDSTAQGLIDEVSQEEMFHCQSAWNIAKAFGTPYDFKTRTAFVYEGQNIPHLNFSLESPDPSTTPVTISGTKYDFTKYSATLNPSTFEERINGMCLVEYPDWDAPTSHDLNKDTTDYPSIGHFYAAIKSLMTDTATFADGSLVSSHIQTSNTYQTAMFTGNAPSDISQTVTATGSDGIKQINDLINAIVEEGEGTSSKDGVPTEYQFNGNEEPHFNAFLEVKNKNLSQTALSDSGVSSIMTGLATFLPEVQKNFEASGGSSSFFGAMYAFDDTISSAFSS